MTMNHPTELIVKSGSAVVVKTQTGQLVITNKHVVTEGYSDKRVMLEFPSKEQIHGTILAMDDQADLAAIKLDKPWHWMVELAAREPQPGQTLFQIGYPNGKLTQRNGQFVHRNTGAGATRDEYHLAMSFHDGDSGGPVFDQ